MILGGLAGVVLACSDEKEFTVPVEGMGEVRCTVYPEKRRVFASASEDLHCRYDVGEGYHCSPPPANGAVGENTLRACLNEYPDLLSRFEGDILHK